MVKSKNILYILDGYYPSIGGAEILFQYLAEGMVKEGRNVNVLTLWTPKTEKMNETYNGVHIVRVKCPRILFAFYGLKASFQLAKTASLIHTTTYASALLGRITAKFSKKPVVLTVHEVYNTLWFRFMGKLRGLFLYFAEKFVISLPYDHYIGPSLYTINSIRLIYGIPDKKLSVVYNGIDYVNRDRSRFSEQEILKLRGDLIGEKRYVGLYFGRAGVGKGCIDLIESIPLVIEHIPNFTCCMILSFTPEWSRQKIERLIQKLGIQNHIVLHDSVSYKELPKYILMSDLAIVPSHAEGFGFAAAEVSALGHPLITTQIASLPEVVSGKIVFCKPGDQESIANSIVSMYQGKYSLLSEKRFERTECIEKHVDLYKSLR